MEGEDPLRTIHGWNFDPLQKPFLPHSCSIQHTGQPHELKTALLSFMYALA